MFLSGLLLFAASSLAVGLTTSAGPLLAARAVQGVSAAALAPPAVSILVTSFPNPVERGKAFGHRPGRRHHIGGNQRPPPSRGRQSRLPRRDQHLQPDPPS